MASKGAVYNTFCGIPTSQPDAGVFDFTNTSVVYQIVEWYGSTCVAFVIEHSRLGDLLAGEEERGQCKLIVHEKKEGSSKYLCSFGKLRRTADHAKVSAGPSQAAEGHKRSAVAFGDSCKRGCQYWLKWNLLLERNGVAVVGVLVNARGQHSEVQGKETVRVLEHVDGRGGKLSEECRLYVRKQLQLDLTTGQIQKGACIIMSSALEATCSCSPGAGSLNQCPSRTNSDCPSGVSCGGSCSLCLSVQL